jgi:hypothetical protein
MTKEEKQARLYFVIALVTAIFISQMAFWTVLKPFAFPYHVIGILFVWTITYVSHYLLIKTVKEKPKAFITMFMTQFALRLLFFVTYALVGAVVVYKNYMLAFIFHFFATYLFFAVLEVSLILKFVKGQSSQPLDSNNVKSKFS